MGKSLRQAQGRLFNSTAFHSGRYGHLRGQCDSGTGGKIHRSWPGRMVDVLGGRKWPAKTGRTDVRSNRRSFQHAISLHTILRDNDIRKAVQCSNLMTISNIFQHLWHKKDIICPVQIRNPGSRLFANCLSSLLTMS